MKEVLKVAGLTLLALAFLVALGFTARWAGLQSNTFFRPKEEALRREVVETSKAYRDGMVMDLRALQVEYVMAPADIKPALATAIRHRAVGVDQSTLPPDLQAFLATLP